MQPENIRNGFKLYILQQVRGSGPEGQIRAADLAGISPGAPPATVAAPVGLPGQLFIDIPLNNIRQVSMLTDTLSGHTTLSQVSVTDTCSFFQHRTNISACGLPRIILKVAQIGFLLA